MFHLACQVMDCIYQIYHYKHHQTLTFSVFVFLWTGVAAEPLPDLPPPREKKAYKPIVIQQHLSLWDSLHFTDKVGSLRGVTDDYIIYRMVDVLRRELSDGCRGPARMRAERKRW